MSKRGDLSGVRGAKSMDFRRDREDIGGGGLVTYLVMNLARIKVLTHLNCSEEKPSMCGLGIEEQDGDS